MNAGKPPTRRFAHTVVWAAAESSDSMGEITGKALALSASTCMFHDSHYCDAQGGVVAQYMHSENTSDAYTLQQPARRVGNSG